MVKTTRGAAQLHLIVQILPAVLAKVVVHLRRVRAAVALFEPKEVQSCEDLPHKQWQCLKQIGHGLPPFFLEWVTTLRAKVCVSVGLCLALRTGLVFRLETLLDLGPFARHAVCYPLVFLLDDCECLTTLGTGYIYQLFTVWTCLGKNTFQLPTTLRANNSAHLVRHDIVPFVCISACSSRFLRPEGRCS